MAQKLTVTAKAKEDDSDSIDAPQETEQDLGELAPEDFDAVMAATDWTTETLIGQLTKGNIFLNPNFQRRDAWTAPRKSQFIESLILGFPVPQIVLAERKERKGSYLVIDGKQRLLSLAQFAAAKNGDYKQLFLQDLKIRDELNGYNYASLKDDPNMAKFLSAFENQTIRTVVIKNWPNETFIYTVFLRLNTNSVQLSAQELRQALHPGPFSKRIDDYSIESASLKRILKSKEPDFRMRDVELILRFLSFHNFLRNYKGSFKSFLDDTTKHLNSKWAEESKSIEQQLELFERGVTATFEIFGEQNAFRKWNGQRFEGAFNRAIFDIMLESFVIPSVAKAAIAKKQAVVTAFKNLCSDDREFLSSIESTTKSISAVATRFSKWGRTISKITKHPLPIPKVENGVIEME